MSEVGKYMAIAGGLLLLSGLILWGVGNKLPWFGHLPGDIRIERNSYRIYIPLTSMLLVTLIMNLAIWAIKKFF